MNVLKVKNRSKDGFPVLKEIPKGWVRVDAPNIPKEYFMVSNNKSRFKGERETALIRRRHG